MTHTYTVKGMTCGGCRQDVEDKLNAMPSVQKAKVDLEKEEAELELQQPVSVQELQQALPAKYKISKKDKASINVFQNTNESEPETSKLRALRPLLLILGYIAIATVLMHRNDFDLSAVMLDFMGLFFIVFSFFKILDLEGFPNSFRMYDPLAKILPLYAWVYPFIETALGLMFLMRFEVNIAIVITLVILSITTIGVARSLLQKKAIQCACLGTALKLPMTEATLIENAIMIVMGVSMLLMG